MRLETETSIRDHTGSTSYHYKGIVEAGVQEPSHGLGNYVVLRTAKNEGHLSSSHPIALTKSEARALGHALIAMADDPRVPISTRPRE